MQVNQWQNCYDDGWKGIIVPEAFAHPAKMSYGLLKRILEHTRDEKWIRPRDIVLDPFGGIGSTGIIGAYADLRVVCVELERKFVDLAEQNFKLHDNAWQKFGNPRPIILQGDSRRLCELVEKADCIVSSPPYAGALGNRKHEGDQQKYYERQKKYNEAHPEHKRPSAESMCYPCSDGNLAAMKPGKVDMVVSSPPYAEGGTSERGTEADTPGKRQDLEGWRNRPKHIRAYGTTPGNLGNLKSGDVNLILSSPPYEKQQEGGGIQKSVAGLSDYPVRGGLARSKKAGRSAKGFGYHGQGNSEGQLGNDKGDTFWVAARTIVEQCHQILKPGGHAIWVVKSFVRNKKIVDFPGDWRRLCESAGFKTVCIHHAMLVKETTHKTLFGHTEVKRKERKSFFRRLAESKGSPRIDFEVVLCMEK